MAAAWFLDQRRFLLWIMLWLNAARSVDPPKGASVGLTPRCPDRCEYVNQTSHVRCKNLGSLDIVLDQLNSDSTQILVVTNSPGIVLRPAMFQQFLRLEYLVLAGNEIVRVPNGSFFGLKSLQLLSLSHNSIEELPEGVFAGLEGLLKLDLSGNLLARFPPNILAPFTMLDVLYLDGNRITDIDWAVLVKVSATLTALQLSGNRMNALPAPPVFSKFFLSRLDVSQNRIDRIESNAFVFYANLFDVNLSDNQLQTLYPSTFAGLHAVRRMDLSINVISWIFTGALHPLANCATLDLSRNRLETLEYGTFLGLVSLETLLLDHNRLISIDASHLLPLPNLRQVVVSGNYFRCDCEMAVTWMAVTINSSWNVPTWVDAWRRGIGAPYCASPSALAGHQLTALDLNTTLCLNIIPDDDISMTWTQRRYAFLPNEDSPVPVFSVKAADKVLKRTTFSSTGNEISYTTYTIIALVVIEALTLLICLICQRKRIRKFCNRRPPHRNDDVIHQTEENRTDVVSRENPFESQRLNPPRYSATELQCMNPPSYEAAVSGDNEDGPTEEQPMMSTPSVSSDQLECTCTTEDL